MSKCLSGGNNRTGAKRCSANVQGRVDSGREEGLERGALEAL